MPASTLPTRSAGCGKTAPSSPARGDAVKVDVGGAERSFVRFIPKSYDASRSYPLVFVFHGMGADGPAMADYIKMQDYAAGDAVVVFPSATNGRWDTKGPSDLTFFDAVVKDVGATACIDEQRVFVLGFSMGAYMVNYLACNRAEAVRAFAAADGGFAGDAARCGKTAGLVYHRTEDDDEVIANGKKARDTWLAINGCSSSAKPVTDFGFSGLGCSTYEGCPASAPIVWCEDTAHSPYKHDLRDVYRTPIWRWFAQL